MNDRQNIIYDYIRQQGRVHTSELKTLCPDSSTMTLWRDLERLESLELIKRVHGGAIDIHAESAGFQNDTYEQRATKNVNGKKAIAMAALKYVQPGESVLFDCGSTIMALAQIFPDNGATVITSGINIANEMAKRKSCTTICNGGNVDPNTMACIGPQTEAALTAINVDLMFVATGGYTLNVGFTGEMPYICQLRRLAMAKAQKKIMLMDISKIGRSLPYTFATLEDIDLLIVDAPLQEDIEQEALRVGVEVVVAPNIGQA